MLRGFGVIGGHHDNSLCTLLQSGKQESVLALNVGASLEVAKRLWGRMWTIGPNESCG